MTITQILHSFAADQQVQAALVLIAADVIFGVLAALRTNTFELARIADTLRDDVLGKLAPFLAIFALGKVSNDEVLGVVDFGTIATIAWGGLALALGASILKSLGDLGVQVPKVIAGQSKTPPPAE